jgi:putative (di)nucleoside polyphosphate hydrolase
MADSPPDLPSITVAELIADPIVQMLMKADNVTPDELTNLIRAIETRVHVTQAEADHKAKDPLTSSEYRPGVGIMLLNRNNRVLVGHRRKPKGLSWQMPQGGIEPGETPLDAALRELREEVGVSDVEILAESRIWLCYDLPDNLVGSVWQGKWRGQRQKWFAMRLRGSDADVKVDGHEFDDWKWVRIGELAELIVPFKRDVYLSVLAEFRDAIAR